MREGWYQDEDWYRDQHGTWPTRRQLITDFALQLFGLALLLAAVGATVYGIVLSILFLT